MPKREYKAKKPPVPESSPASIYELNFFRMKAAAVAIVLGVLCLAGLDSLKPEKPLSEELDVRGQYAQAIVKSKVEALKKDVKSADNIAERKQDLDNFIKNLDKEFASKQSDLRQQLDDSGTALHYVHVLVLAASIAVIAVCGLYLLYTLAYWLKIPATPTGLPTPDGSQGKPSVAAGAAQFIGIAGMAGAMSKMILSAAMLATVATAVSGALVIRHIDGEDGPDGKDGARGADGRDALFRQPSDQYVFIHNDAEPPPRGFVHPTIPVAVTATLADQKVDLRADASWTASTASLNSTAVLLAETSRNLVDYGKTLKEQSPQASQQNWAEVHKQLSMVAAGASNLLDSGRLANQRANTAMAVLLGRDCYHQTTEAYIVKASVGVESEQSSLLNRMHKEPCAELPQMAAKR